MNLINICGNCGARNFYTRRTCGYCGSRLGNYSGGTFDFSNIVSYLSSKMTRTNMLYAVLAVIIIVVAAVAFAQWGPKADSGAPQISNIQVTNRTKSSVTITWQTNEPASSQVEYGRNTTYGMFSPLTPQNDPTIKNVAGATSHNVLLTGLSSNTTYHFRVRSKDANSNEAVSTQDMTFKTSEATPFAVAD